MSERWRPKELLRRRQQEIASGASIPGTAPIAPAAPAAATASVLLCRAHGMPWRACPTCSSSKTESR
jgi:hypothetical protein